MLLSHGEAKAIFICKPKGGGSPPIQIGDDSIGWKQSRAIAQANRKLERTPLMRQVAHQPRKARKPGTPPCHVKSIDFGGLVSYGRPTKQAQEHFQALIKVKKGVWNETTRPKSGKNTVSV